MKPTNPPSGINRRVLLSAGAALPFLPPLTATAQQKTEGSNLGFSFVVYGDSRSMMYLPYKSDQREEAIKLMAAMCTSSVTSTAVGAGTSAFSPRLGSPNFSGSRADTAYPFGDETRVLTRR